MLSIWSTSPATESVYSAAGLHVGRAEPVGHRLHGRLAVGLGHAVGQRDHDDDVAGLRGVGPEGRLGQQHAADRSSSA